MPKLGVFEAMGLEPPDLTFGPDTEEDDVELTPYQIARERADEIRARYVESIASMLSRVNPRSNDYAAQAGKLEAMLEHTCLQRDELIGELERLAVELAAYGGSVHLDMLANRWGLCLESEE
jgi:hypothetical protein